MVLICIRTEQISLFQDAVNYLGSHEKVVADRLGVIGVSRGAEMGLFMAAVCNKVSLVLITKHSSRFYAIVVKLRLNIIIHTIF